MKTFRLADYAAEGILKDLEDARFFARKLGPEDRLDFEGVLAVSSDFLDTLLAGQKPECLEGRILNPAGTVDEALAAWVDRHLPGRTPVPPPPKIGARPPVAARARPHLP